MIKVFLNILAIAIIQSCSLEQQDDRSTDPSNRTLGFSLITSNEGGFNLNFQNRIQIATYKVYALCNGASTNERTESNPVLSQNKNFSISANCQNPDLHLKDVDVTYTDVDGGTHQGLLDDSGNAVNFGENSLKITRQKNGTSYEFKIAETKLKGTANASVTLSETVKFDWITKSTIPGYKGFDLIITSADLDAAGNLYVTGYGSHLKESNSKEDWFVKKYNPQGTEDLNWNLAIDIENKRQFAKKIALAPNGDVYVAGQAGGPVYADGDVLIKKFSNGSEITTGWPYKDDTGQGGYGATAAKVDAQGNLFAITSTAGDHIITLHKFNSSGVEQWSSSHNDGAGSNEAEAMDLTFDSLGNIYVLSSIWSGWGGFKIRKYNSSGVEETVGWPAFFYDSSYKFKMPAIELVQEGAETFLYIAGYRVYQYGSQTTYSIVKKYRIDPTGQTEITSGWNFSTLNEKITDLKIDQNGNIYLLVKNGVTNFVVRKYNQAGIQDTSVQWSFTIGNGEAITMILDEINQLVYVLGWEKPTGLPARGFIKSFSLMTGAPIVSNTIEAHDGSHEEVRDCAVNANGEIYITGNSNNTVSLSSKQDWWVRRFDENGALDSSLAWEKNFDGTGYDDEAGALAVSSTGDVFAVGIHKTNSIYSEAKIKKFSTSGVEDSTNWNKSISIQGTFYDLAIDSQDNVYASGTRFSGYYWKLHKYGPDGSNIWNKEFSLLGFTTCDFSNVGFNLTMDASDDVYATGCTYNSSTGGQNVYVNKIDGGLGTLTWRTYINSPGANYTQSRTIDWDGNGNLYSLGSSKNAYIAKFSSNGTLDPDWQSNLATMGFTGGYEFIRHINVNDGIVFIGYNTINGQNAIILSKIDYNGTKVWDFNFPESQTNLASIKAVCTNPDKTKLYLSGEGWRYGNSKSGRDYWLGQITLD